MASNNYLLASQKAELAVKADSDRRLADAMRYYEEASQHLVEYCKEDQSQYGQMSKHIHRYVERASEIQRELLKNQSASEAASEAADYNGPQVDANAQRQLQDMGLTIAQARDALIRFDNDVERSITWFLENPVEEDEDAVPSRPTERPTSLPPASTIRSSPNPNPPARPPARTTQPPPPLPSRSPPPPPLSASRGVSPPRTVPTPFQPPAPPARIGSSSAPVLNTRPPPAKEQPSKSSTSVTSSSTSGGQCDTLSQVLQSACVSPTETCRCIMFTQQRGAICGMPAALVGDSDVAGDLCWSCKYMEAMTGLDALLANSDDDVDEDQVRKKAEEAQVKEAEARAKAEAEAQAEVATVPLPVPAPPPPEEPKGWFSGWLGGNKNVKEKEFSNGALSRKEREGLEDEFSALKNLKVDGKLSESQKARFKLVRRSLRTNEALVKPLGVEAVTSPPSPRSPRRSSVKAAETIKEETASQKTARLRKVLQDARVSETETCTCTLYTLAPGEVCGRPAAMAVDTETGVASPTKMCWQCKRIEAYSS